MTYHIILYHFLKETTFILLFGFKQNVVVKLLSAYFAFVEDDYSSTLAAAISLL